MRAIPLRLADEAVYSRTPSDSDKQADSGRQSVGHCNADFGLGNSQYRPTEHSGPRYHQRSSPGRDPAARLAHCEGEERTGECRAFLLA